MTVTIVMDDNVLQNLYWNSIIFLKILSILLNIGFLLGDKIIFQYFFFEEKKICRASYYLDVIVGLTENFAIITLIFAITEFLMIYCKSVYKIADKLVDIKLCNCQLHNKMREKHSHCASEIWNNDVAIDGC